jgi:hypothetical protein
MFGAIVGGAIAGLADEEGMLGHRSKVGCDRFSERGTIMELLSLVGLMLEM